jgi:hypothetical protein
MFYYLTPVAPVVQIIIAIQLRVKEKFWHVRDRVVLHSENIP